MKHATRLLTLAIIVMTYTASAQEDPEKAAVAAMGDFINAWNTGDKNELGKTLNYPNFTLFGSGLNIANEADEFSVNFEQMRNREDWQRSTFEDFQSMTVTPEQVHLSCTYKRFNSKDEAYQTGRVFYIVTKQNGHWGMQLRSPLRATEANRESEAAARTVIEEFFPAWNAEDNDGVNKVINFPHAFLIRGGRTAIAQGPEQQQTNFAAMREREGWDKSEYKDLKFTYSDANTAFAQLTFTRHKANGDIYTTVPVLWIITKENNHWGIQFRAILGQV